MIPLPPCVAPMGGGGQHLPIALVALPWGGEGVIVIPATSLHDPTEGGLHPAIALAALPRQGEGVIVVPLAPLNAAVGCLRTPIPSRNHTGQCRGVRKETFFPTDAPGCRVGGLHRVWGTTAPHLPEIMRRMWEWAAPHLYDIL